MSQGQARLGASGVRHLRIPALTGANGHVPMKMSRSFLYIFIGFWQQRSAFWFFFTSAYLYRSRLPDHLQLRIPPSKPG
jgi:hypothetical protein